VAGSEELRNPQDDYSIMVFKPEVRGKTDRFVMLFEKP
jgi:predicted methyltransferase